MDEQLVHNEHRDRTITETVDAAVEEYQKGSSFMGGLAQSAGASGSYGGMLGAAIGTAWSLGGSTANSSGSRNIAANTVQKINDNISQASASKRELQSTVVVHSVQAEKEAIETRTVVNYNHSHALTILYYEVLRHFRAVTERTRTTAALLVQYQAAPFFTNVPLPAPAVGSTRVDTGLMAAYSSVLKTGLQDAKFAAAFDALDRIQQRNKVAAFTPTVEWRPGDVGLVYFTVALHTGGQTPQEGVNVALFGALYDGPNQMVRLVTTNLSPPNNVDNLEIYGSFHANDRNDVYYAVTDDKAPRKWSDIRAIRLGFGGIDVNKTPLGITHIKITGSDMSGTIVTLYDADCDFVFRNDTDILLETKHPDPPPPTPALSADQINDQALVDELLDHLQQHKEYYNRLIWLSEDPLIRAGRFDTDPFKWKPDSTLLDHLDNRPVEIISNWVAFPTPDKNINDAIQALELAQAGNAEQLDLILNERLVTLPTRGVFAEAKLGHCNASEEIDNTRFWDWQTSPIPHLAPEIAPVTPVTPQPQQQNLQPTPFPQSLINIVNPPSEPDPTGLAAPLNVLATPNIFRDMSGQAQVEDLLKKLSDNTISIAQASNMARQIQQNSGGATGGSSPSPAGASGFGARANPTQPSAATRDLGDLRTELQRGVGDGMISQGDANAAYTNASNRLGSGQPLLAFGVDAGVADAGAADGGVDAGAASGLNAGNFATYVNSNQLDLEIADLLRRLDGYPADSWAKQMASFAYHELQAGNLYGIVSSSAAGVGRIQSVLPAGLVASAASAAATVTVANGVTMISGSKGAWKGFTILSDSLVQASLNSGAGRTRLAQVLSHELTHFRSRDYFQELIVTPPSSSASLYLDLAKANAHTETQRTLDYIIEKIVCNHVGWRVDQDIQAKRTGVPAKANPDKLGFFRYALAKDPNSWPDNGYLADMEASGKYNEQIALWMQKIGGGDAFNGLQVLYHDDQTKNTLVRQLFKDVYDAAKPAFPRPTVPPDGGV